MTMSSLLQIASKMFGLYLDSTGVDVLAVDRDDLRGFIEHSRERGLSQRTIELIFSVLSSFYEYLVYERRFPF